MTGITTVSGEMIDFTNLKSNKYKIEDIAFALSNICRFGGHCKQFYSVAQHCVLMSRATETHAKEALLHDAAEAYLGDVCSPLKKLLTDYLTIEKKIEQQLAKVFNLPCPKSPEIKRLDLIMLATEQRDLIPSDPDPNIIPLEKKIRPWSPGRSKEEFLYQYAQL